MRGLSFVRLCARIFPHCHEGAYKSIDPFSYHQDAQGSCPIAAVSARAALFLWQRLRSCQVIVGTALTYGDCYNDAYANCHADRHSSTYANLYAHANGRTAAPFRERAPDAGGPGTHPVD